METERKFNLTPEEQRQRQEVLRRQRILQGLEGGQARKKLKEELNKLTPEEQAFARRKLEERE